MKISGFSFVRNGDTLGYPVAESIRSVLPLCDEFVIAVGKGDRHDSTRKTIESIKSDKINIIDTEWTDVERLRGSIYSRQTNIALDRCSGDWCFYIQCDEVVHEKYLSHIKENCNNYLNDPSVEGFLFNYKHFWGDYDHYIVSHKWYPREVRIIRNRCGISSIGDAQSFQKNGKKVKVIQLDAEIYHYGYVRHPKLMQVRNRKITSNYWGKEKAREMFQEELFDYGSLEKLSPFSETYPAVMKERIEKMDWKELLQYTGASTVKHDHDKLKARILTFLEQKLFRGSGRQPWGYKNYCLLKRARRRKKDNSNRHGKQPAISLIIAVYEHADFLEKIFLSLMNQTFQNFEIIVADDGSGDSIKEVIGSFAGRFTFPIKHAWHKDEGFRKTVIINRAVSRSDADYLVFIDGDCILHHRFLEFHYKRRKANTVLVGRRVMYSKLLTKRLTASDITTGRFEKIRFWLFENDGKTAKQGIFLPGIFYLRNIFPFKRYLLVGSNFSLFKRDYRRINGYDERIIGRALEDDNLYARFLLIRYRIKSVVYEALQYHLHHSFDPVPHSQEFINAFRNPRSYWSEYGMVKKSNGSES